MIIHDMEPMGSSSILGQMPSIIGHQWLNYGFCTRCQWKLILLLSTKVAGILEALLELTERSFLELWQHEAVPWMAPKEKTRSIFDPTQIN